MARPIGRARNPASIRPNRPATRVPIGISDRTGATCELWRPHRPASCRCPNTPRGRGRREPPRSAAVPRAPDLSNPWSIRRHPCGRQEADAGARIHSGSPQAARRGILRRNARAAPECSRQARRSERQIPHRCPGSLQLRCVLRGSGKEMYRGGRPAAWRRHLPAAHAGAAVAPAGYELVGAPLTNCAANALGVSGSPVACLTSSFHV